MKLILAIVFMICCAASCWAATWYARNDGGTTVQCNGHTDQSLALAIGTNCAYASLQNAVDAEVAGDVIIARSGDTWDGTLLVPNKSCTALLPCIVKSSALAALPAGRVAPVNAANMARLRSMGGGNNGGAIQMQANADYWTFDGFELTDANPSHFTSIAMLIDSSIQTVDHLTIQHCYLHQKETGTNYNRTVQRGIQFEGDGLIFKFNYVYIIGYYYPEIQGGNDHYQMDTTTLLMIGTATNVLMEDNYSSVWWNQIFTGGGDSDPQNTATLTGATTGTATFSNTTGLAPGVMLRLSFVTTGTFSRFGSGSMQPSCGDPTYPAFPSNGPPDSTGVQFVRSGGFALTSSDIIHYGKVRNVVDAQDHLIGLCEVTGNNYRIASTRSTNYPTDGAATLTIYETALVNTVNTGTGVVTYTPYGFNLLASSGAVSADWNYGDQGLIGHVTVRRNTFYVDPVFAHDVWLNGGHNYSPKGLYELKNIVHFIFEGNYVLGYPTLLGLYPGNQYGTAPWSTANDIIIRNNWIAPDLGYPESSRDAIWLVDAANYATIAPTGNYQVYNNFSKNTTAFLAFKRSDNVQVYHNTSLGCVGCAFYGNTSAVEGINGPVTNFTFRDNIIGYSAYGAHCQAGSQATCWPSGAWQNNVVVNNDTFNAGTIHCGASSEWAPGAALCPVKTAYNQVGFTNMATDIYSLDPSSDYHHLATDGTDPGVDWTALTTALGTAPVSTVTVCNWHTTPACSATPVGSTTAGIKNILFIRARHSDHPDGCGNSTCALPSDSDLNSWASSSHSDFQTASLGTFGVTWTLGPVVALPHTVAYYAGLPAKTTSTLADATDLAQAAGYNWASYDIVIVWIPSQYGVYSAYVGLNYPHIWLEPNDIVGQTYGVEGFVDSFYLPMVARANTWRTNDATVLGSAGFADPSGNNDPYDTFGQEAVGSNYSLYHKREVGWIPESYITTVAGSGTATYRIYAHDTESVLTPGRKYGIKMPGHNGTQYWIEYRDANVYGFRGLLINWGGLLLLDMTPSPGSNTPLNSPLAIGLSWTDPEGRIINASASGGASPKYCDVIITIP